MIFDTSYGKDWLNYITTSILKHSHKYGEFGLFKPVCITISGQKNKIFKSFVKDILTSEDLPKKCECVCLSIVVFFFYGVLGFSALFEPQVLEKESGLCKSRCVKLS